MNAFHTYRSRCEKKEHNAHQLCVYIKTLKHSLHFTKQDRPGQLLPIFTASDFPAQHSGLEMESEWLRLEGTLEIILSLCRLSALLEVTAAGVV